MEGGLHSAPLREGSLGGSFRGAPPPLPQGSSVARASPHLLLRGLDEQEGGLMSFTLEIKPGGKDHTCQASIPPLATAIWRPQHLRSPGCLGETGLGTVLPHLLGTRCGGQGPGSTLAQTFLSQDGARAWQSPGRAVSWPGPSALLRCGEKLHDGRPSAGTATCQELQGSKTRGTCSRKAHRCPGGA